MTDPIYLDHNATTPVAPEVFSALAPWLQSQFGNPSSSHAYGRRAAHAVSCAREQVATLIGARPQEIVFTGCATEANNLAPLGVARAMGPFRRHLVISAIEHPAVAAPAAALRDQGWAVSVVPVDAHGTVSAAAVEQALRPDTALVSLMHANNEVGKLPVSVDALGVDLLTMAGHKFSAPKGVGALYVRTGTPLRSILHGADQEQGLRPGTENVALIVALGAAAALASAELPALTHRLRALRDRLHARLADGIPGLQLNGHPELRLPNTLHVSFPGVSGRSLLAQVADRVAASVGSACLPL
jgi:cysteine desulfurase